MSAQIGSNAGSVRLRPATLAMTMTPTAPSSQLLASSSTARDGYSHGSEASQRMRSGWTRWASAIVAFDSRAASLLTSSPPQ